MANTLLQLVQAACREVGIIAPNAVASSTDQQFIQLYGLASAIGQQLLTDFEWQKSSKEHTFTIATSTQTGTLTSGSPIVTGLTSTAGFAANTWMVNSAGLPSNVSILSVDSATQVTLDQNATASGAVTLNFAQTIYDLPSDWDRQVNRTHWDRTNFWELMGPKSAQEWGWLHSAIVAVGPRIRYRILDNKFQIWPTNVGGFNCAYEYISQNWVIATGDTDASKTAFSADSDTCIFRDRLMIAALKFKFWEIKGFDVTKLEEAYLNELGKAQAQDAGAPTLSLGRRTPNIYISPANIRDGNWPG